jgi:hypothetical protein
VGDLIGTYWATYRDDIVLLFQAKTKEFNLGSPNQEIAELGFFPSPNLPEPFSPNMRIRLKDAIEGRRGVFRVFESLGVIRS